MKIAVFDARAYDRPGLQAASVRHGHELVHFESRLGPATAALAHGFDAVSVFVNDRLDEATLAALAEGGVRAVALRCAGYDNVDLAACARLGLVVLRVPTYSPHAVAEHAVALLLCLNRKLNRASARVREGNFDLAGLVGYDLHGKTVGVLGTGNIGRVFAGIMRGFGCRVLAFDRAPDLAWANSQGVTYAELDAVLQAADVVSLHLPLTPESTHLIDAAAIARMKPGVVLINTGRGGLIDTPALVDGLKRRHVSAAGLDVYEREAGIFFVDHSAGALEDDVLARLLTFPNVLITGHQAFLTEQALHAIADTTLGDLAALQAGRTPPNAIPLPALC